MLQLEAAVLGGLGPGPDLKQIGFSTAGKRQRQRSYIMCF